MANEYESANVAAKWWTEVVNLKHNIDEIQACFFNELLEDRINHELDESPILELECDYHPCSLLAEIAEEVAIGENLFNFKCIMVITRNRVLIKDPNNTWLELYPTNEMF